MSRFPSTYDSEDRRQATKRIFTPSGSNERPPGELELQAALNWARIDSVRRRKCLDHLRAAINPEAMAHWRDQVVRGVVIGSDDVRFHFSLGMWIRNKLREVMPDTELPGIDYGNAVIRNWDDYYTAALFFAVVSE